ncbi:MAG: hypothetical protein JWN48_1777 [Myxococcaceae bacterium]|nr:hypothetical protein [Myxococcaceae bacterium]
MIENESTESRAGGASLVLRHTLVGLLAWAAGALGCAPSDEEDPPFARPSPRLDAGPARSQMDASSSPASYDAGAACAPLSACSEGKPSLLYNVCVTGTASGAASAEATCLVDSNGVLYLVALASGQAVVNRGFTQSAGSTGSTLSAADEQRCAEARAALSTDAAPPCMKP